MVISEQEREDILRRTTASAGQLFIKDAVSGKIVKKLCSGCWWLYIATRPCKSVADFYGCTGDGLSETVPCTTPLESRKVTYGE